MDDFTEYAGGIAGIAIILAGIMLIINGSDVNSAIRLMMFGGALLMCFSC